MNYVLWAVLGSALIISAEGLYRSGNGWLERWWLYGPLAIAISLCVYKTLTAGPTGAGSPTYLARIILFPLFNGVARIAVSQFLLGEPMAKGNILAAVALLVGAIGGRFWR